MKRYKYIKPALFSTILFSIITLSLVPIFLKNTPTNLSKVDDIKISTANQFYDHFGKSSSDKFRLQDIRNSTFFISSDTTLNNGNVAVNANGSVFWTSYDQSGDGFDIVSIANNFIAIRGNYTNRFWYGTINNNPSNITTLANSNDPNLLHRFNWTIFINDLDQISIYLDSMLGKGFISSYDTSVTEGSFRKLTYTQTPNYFNVHWKGSGYPIYNIEDENDNYINIIQNNLLINYTLISSEINALVGTKVLSSGIATFEALNQSKQNLVLFSAQYNASSILADDRNGAFTIPSIYIGDNIFYKLSFVFFNEIAGFSANYSIVTTPIVFQAPIPIISNLVLTYNSISSNLTFIYDLNLNNSTPTSIRYKIASSYENIDGTSWINVTDLTAITPDENGRGTFVVSSISLPGTYNVLLNFSTNPTNILNGSFNVTIPTGFVNPEITNVNITPSANTANIEFDYTVNDGGVPVYSYFTPQYLKPLTSYTNAERFYEDLGVSFGTKFLIQDSVNPEYFMSSSIAYNSSYSGAAVASGYGISRWNDFTLAGQGFSVGNSNLPGHLEIVGSRSDGTNNFLISQFDIEASNVGFFTRNENRSRWKIVTNNKGQIAIQNIGSGNVRANGYISSFADSRQTPNGSYPRSNGQIDTFPSWFNIVIVNDINTQQAVGNFSSDQTNLSIDINSLLNSSTYYLYFMFNNEIISEELSYWFQTTISSTITNLSISSISTTTTASYTLTLNGQIGLVEYRVPYTVGSTPGNWLIDSNASEGSSNSISFQDLNQNLDYAFEIRVDGQVSETITFRPFVLGSFTSFSANSSGSGLINITYNLVLNDSFLWVDFRLNNTWYHHTAAQAGNNTIALTNIASGTYQIQLRLNSNVFSTILTVVVT